MVDFQQLRQLVTIAELGSLSAAAEKLHISQPALSRSMQRLEAYLGLTLFERKKNRIVFRELGLLAVERANSLLTDANRFIDDLHAYAAKLSIVLIGSSTPAPMWRLSTEIHERFPELVVTEEQVASAPLVEGLRDGHFRLILHHIPVEEPGILCRKYTEERMQLELPPSHRLCGKKAIEPEDLNGLTALVYRHVGVWKERVKKFEGLHIIEQPELDVLLDLAQSSGLPLLTSSLTPTPTASLGGRVTLPILGEAATLSLYLCARKEDAELFERLC